MMFTTRSLPHAWFFGTALLLGLALYPAGVYGQIAVVSGLSEEHAASPGETYEGIIDVRNETAEPQEVRVYQTDYLFYADGTNLYNEPGSHPRSNAGWISYNPDYFVLTPGSTASVTYSVTVPANSDTLSGSYWSMLMVEGVPKGSAESTLGDAQTQVGIRTMLRFGVQITTDIAGTGSRLVAFENPSLENTEEGGRMLRVDLLNAGLLAMRPDVWLELYDEQGQSHGRIEGSALRIYPGTSVRQRFDLSAVAAGRYRAFLFADAGGSEVFGAQYTLEL
jgi:hypothetical protein